MAEVDMFFNLIPPYENIFLLFFENSLTTLISVLYYR